MTLLQSLLGALLLAAIGAVPLVLPQVLPLWLISLITVALSTGLVVAGLIILWRAGLVPFGQALFFATGAYAVALAGRWFAIHDAFVLVLIGALAATLVASVVGILLARYREIFFAMLSMALSMILYGVLVKSEALGSTDGINVAQASFAGLKPRGPAYTFALFWLALGLVYIAWVGVTLYLNSVAGQLAGAIRDNEIRVEYLGISVTRLVHLKLTIAAALAGMGGALTALSISHVDPAMAYWTTSGGFVFVTILAGAASVPTAFIGALVFEMVRSLAVAVLPGAWQLILGSVLLLTILFVPDGLSSLIMRKKAAPPADAQPAEGGAA
jgi:ABC-type branched-subunit amino acid transport system permease subunit